MQIDYFFIQLGAKPEQLNYFRCYVGESGLLVANSEFWGPSVMSEQGMRANFDSSDTMVSVVRIESRVDEGFSITEIEVHTLGKCCKNITISILSCLYHLTFTTLSIRPPW